jgi:hypothetical protein
MAEARRWNWEIELESERKGKIWKRSLWVKERRAGKHRTIGCDLAGGNNK